jgi:hypothetical protein
VGVILPGDWWTIPPADDDARRRAVTAMVDRRFGHADANAGLKRQVRNELLASAGRAAESGGWLMALMLAQAGPVPLPATLTAYRLAGSFADAEGLRKVQESLAGSLPNGGRLDAGEGPFGMVLRTVRERRGPVELGGQDVPVLVCEYWSDPVDGQGLASLIFSTPLVELRDGFIDLFNAIAGTLYLVDDESEDDEQVDDEPVDDEPVDSASGDRAVPDLTTTAAPDPSQTIPTDTSSTSETP